MPKDGKLKEGNRVSDRLKQAGAAVGIDFTGKTDRYPNSVAAHTVLDWALETKGTETQGRLQEVLFRHYFTDGRYPDETNLRAAAEEVGLDGEKAVQAIQDDARRLKIQQEAADVSRAGVSGVPFFCIGKSQFSGAHPPATLIEEIQKAC